MPFNIALSGLNAAAADLKVTGNNIANASTTGFKESRAQFADVFAQSFGGISKTAIGSGVRLAAVTQQFGQGNIDFTGNNLDLAINGSGFFVLSQDGSRLYSRDGAMRVDRDGFIVNTEGARLQVYTPADTLGTSFNTGSMSDLQLNFTEAAPSPTTTMDAIVNLRADASAPPNGTVSGGTFDPDDPDSYNFSTSLTVYDALGQPHTATTYFENLTSLGGTPTLSWNSYVVIDGQVSGPTTMTFNNDGTLASPTTATSFGPFTMDNGAADLNIDVDFSGTTQYGTAYTVNTLRQDGFSSGRLASLDVDASGVVLARFTNGQSIALGKVALASFANPQGLQQNGDNSWSETFAAGDPLLGEAGTGMFGQIQSGGLESSNVDISAQLVNLITAQRNFQANAKTISTADTVTQTIINIR